MTVPRALLVALLPLAALLAGCSSASGNGFTVTAPSAPGGAYVFAADVKADNYTWDLGDHLTTAYGKTVTHAYDFKDGSITVTLKATTAGQAKEYNQPLKLGSGVNQKATFLMEAQTDWTVVGETVKFSAARSFDPENDPLRFQWSCLKTAEATRLPSHTHPVYGVPFASPPAGSVTTGKTNRTLPAPDMTFSGDLCDALGSGTRPSTHIATIAGAFTRTGIYSLYLLASDGPHPTTSGEFKFYVTTPGERPAPVVHKHMAGTLLAGAGGGNLQAVCGNPSNPSPQTCDQMKDTFELALGGLSMQVNFTLDASQGTPAAADQVQWDIKRGDSTVASGTTPGQTTISEPAKLGAGTYTAIVTLGAGANVAYTLDVTARLDMDPAKVY
jgi:major membrane immunogen (membrane-anchored lipoprotein)